MRERVDPWSFISKGEYLERQKLAREAAQNAGLKAIQVRTGKFSAADLNKGITPDGMIDSVAELPQWWQQNMI